MKDLRGLPTNVCFECGSTLFNVKVIFDPDTWAIGMWFLDMECVNCNTLLTAPTPIDRMTGDEGKSSD